jgi:hypothetical protein
LGFVSDWNYLQGLKTNDIDKFILAKKLFPFEKAILTGEAEAYIRSGTVNFKTYNALNLAFYYDPYSIRLYSIRMQYAFVLKDYETAVNDFNQLRILAPNIPIIKNWVDAVKENAVKH